MLWDHLFFISDFKLDVDSPYPIPKKETYKAKPEPMGYPKRHPRFSHLGKNLEMIIDKAITEDNSEKKAGFTNAIAYYMKLAYSNWHKESVHDDAIKSELSAMTKGELDFSNIPYVKHRMPTFEREEHRPTAKRVFSGRTNNGNSNNGNRTGNTGNRNDNRGNGNSFNAAPRGNGVGNRSANGNTRNSNRNTGSTFKKRF